MKVNTTMEKELLLKELENKNIDFASFIFGIEEDVEKSILKYVNTCGGIATTSEIINHIVYENEICGKRRVYRLLESLVSHKFLDKVAQTTNINKYKKTMVYYSINLEE